MTEEILIRSMVCSRCIKVINSELKNIGVHVQDISLGRVLVRFNNDKASSKEIEKVLQENDFEIIRDRETLLAEKVKIKLLEILEEDKQKEVALSKLLARSLGIGYNKLNTVFVQVFGRTIERYWIILKIEKAKELIEYGELSFGEIAYYLGYQTPQSLSRQFKKETGLSMSEYKAIKPYNRINIDRL